MIRFVAIALILSIVSGAVAQISPGSTAPAIDAKEWINAEQPLALNDVRGLVVVVYFWVSFHEGGEQVIGFLSALESNPRLGRSRGVMVIGLTEADKSRAEGMLKKQKTFFPVGVASDAAKKYQIKSFPSIAVIDPNGKVRYCGLPNSANELVEIVLDTVREVPPKRSHPADGPRIRENIKLARECLKSGKFREAFVKARDAFELAVSGDPLKTTCQDLIELIDHIGRDQLADIETLIDGRKFTDAARQLKQLSSDFQGLDVSRVARSRADSLRKQHADVAKAFEADERDAEARGKLFEAQQLMREREFGDAYQGLQDIIKDFPGTPSADAAGRIKQRMEKNATVMKLVNDGVAAEDCKSWIAQARSFASQGQKAKAKDLLRKVIDTYPTTSYADVAKEELAKLP